MLQEENEPRSNEPQGEGAGPMPPVADPNPGGSPGRGIGSRKEQFLIAATHIQGIQPLSVNVIERALRDLPDVEVVDTLYPPGLVGALSSLVGGFAEGMPGAQPVIVARMTEEKAETLRQSIGPRLIMEPDRPLFFSMPEFPPPGLRMESPGMVGSHGTGFTVNITVMGDGAPLEGAEVYLYGSLWPAQGRTNANGQVTLTLFGESLTSLRGLYVRPKADYWDSWVPNPAIDPNQDNVVFLTPLNRTFPNFPNEERFGWGQKAMRLDQLPETYRGQGVKIAIVDSGAATIHQDLQQVKKGFDVVEKNDQTWSQDMIAHGSHCLGVIAGLKNGRGIRGFAPDAEVLVIKIFPGGMFSHLIRALDYCMEQPVDLINLSLGSDQRSQILEQRIQRAKQLGIACIVAAGNSGGPVQYPASSAHVLAVAALGKKGEYPPESHHSTTESSFSNGEGYFSPNFSCFGPEIGVCAPGIAILSTVPPDNYAVWDGTSMAAPHVTGLAALILAHHRDFQGPYKARNAQRVERLFQIIKQSSRPLNLGDPHRTGAGLPDVLKALEISPVAFPTIPTDLLQRLLEVLRSGLPPEVGVAAGTGADLQQLRTAMQEAGLLPAPGIGLSGRTSPTAGPAPVGPLLSPWIPGTQGNGGIARGVNMQQLKAAMQEAGLL